MADVPAKITPAQVVEVVNQALEAPPRMTFTERASAAVRMLFTGWMPPGMPSRSSAPPGTPPRAFPIPILSNTQTRPRQGEAVSFEELRAMSRRATLVRLAIETVKDIDERFDFEVIGKPGRNVKDNDARLDEVRGFIEKPDGRLTFKRWMRERREDQLGIDAPAALIRRTRNGQPFAWEGIAGDTIKPLVDITGRRPLAGPAYDQVLYGQKACDFTAQELVYMPRNSLPDRIYGYGPTEQIYMLCAQVMQAELRQLLDDTQGNVPDVFVKVPKDWTEDQIARAQASLDARKGNLEQRTGILVVPEAGIEQMREGAGQIEKLQFYAREVCWSFSLSPLIFVSQGMNRATGQTMHDMALDEGLIPRQIFWREFLEELIRLTWGWDDISIGWQECRDPDPDIESQIDDRHVAQGVKCRNEVRGKLGLPNIPGGEVYTVTVGNALVRLDDIASGKYQAGFGLAPEEPGDTGTGDEPTDDGGEGLPPIPDGAAVQDTALNGAQISSLLEVVDAVSRGVLTPEAAKAVLVVAFPTIDEVEATRIVSGAKRAPAPETPPIPGPNGEDPDDDGTPPEDGGSPPAPPAGGDEPAPPKPKDAAKAERLAKAARALRKVRTVDTVPKGERNFWLAERATAPPRARPNATWRGGS